MKKRILLALAALAAGFSLSAQEVALKNGTLYTGYVSEQTPAGKVCITYSGAQFSAPGDSLKVYSNGDNTQIRWGDKFFESVYILEEGDMVTFQTYQSGSVYVKLADIDWISYPYMESVRDVVVTSEQTYEGHIMETVVGKYIKMNVNDRVVTISDKKIRSQSRVSADKEKSLNIKMFPYLDVYDVKDMATLTGALVSQNFVDGSAIFLTRDGSLMPLSVSKITGIRKVPNEAYDDTAPVEADTVDVRINGKPALWLEAKIDKKKEIVSFSIKDLGKNILAVTDSYVSVNMVEKKDMMLVPFDPFSAKSQSITLGKASELAEDVAIKPSSAMTSLGRKIMEYDEVKPGFYLVVDVKGARVAPLWVTGR